MRKLSLQQTRHPNSLTSPPSSPSPSTLTTDNSTHLSLQEGETSVHVQRENRRLIAVIVVLFMERLLRSQNERVRYLALYQSLVLVLRELKSLLKRHLHNDRALGSHRRERQIR